MPSPPNYTPAAGDVIHPSTPQKDPVLAVILNVLLSGAGYFYIGQWQKGIVGVFGGITLWIMTTLLMAVCVGVLLIPVCIAYPIVMAFDIHRQTTLLRNGVSIGQWTFFSSHK